MVTLQKKVFVKMYFKSKKKHSIYIMKVLILLLIIILWIIIIKSKYESFTNHEDDANHDDANFTDIIKRLETKDLIDDEILTKLNDYKMLKEELKNTKIKRVKEDIETLKKRYDNTRIQLENILFNKFRPNRLDFNDKQQKFKLNLNSFIDDLKGTNLKITNYGHLDKENCKYPHWKLPKNAPLINNKQRTNIDGEIIKDKYFDPDTKCCTALDGGTRDSCIKQYKKNIYLYNKYKVVLKNGDNKHLELNKIEDDIHIVNLNSQIIEYSKTNQYKTIPIPGNYKNIISKSPEICFKLIEIYDLNHLNQYVINGQIENDLLEYPVYLIRPLKSNKDGITIHNDGDAGQQLSIEPITKELITNQIFYKN
jgi:hypothetical protein